MTPAICHCSIRQNQTPAFIYKPEKCLHASQMPMSFIPVSLKWLKRSHFYKKICSIPSAYSNLRVRNFKDWEESKWMCVNSCVIIDQHLKLHLIFSPQIISVLYDPFFNLSPPSTILDIPVHLLIGCHHFILKIK